MIQLNDFDYESDLSDQNDMLDFFDDPQQMLEFSINQVKQYRFMGDVLLSKAKYIAEAHLTAFKAQKRSDKTAKKNLYCLVDRNTGYVSPRINWRLTVLPSSTPDSQKTFMTQAIKGALSKTTGHYSFDLVFTLTRIQSWEKKVVLMLEEQLFELRLLSKHLSAMSNAHLFMMRRYFIKQPDLLTSFINSRNEILK